MPTYRLHNVKIRSDSQTRSRRELQQQLATLGLLDEDVSAVESLFSEAGSRVLEANIRGSYAEKVAAEVEELAEASGFGPVAFHALEGSKADGYYAVEAADVSRANPNEGRAQIVNISLTPAGTRWSHWRATETALTTVTNDFGNETTAYVGIPDAATKVRWYEPETHAREEASLVETRAGELADVAIYDANASSFADSDPGPTLLYELAYDEEHATACLVWDTRGTDDKTDANGDVQWQKVYSTAHDFAADADMVLDNGLLRVTVDEPANDLTAEEWDDGSDAWTDVALGTSDWEVFDVDLRAVSPARIAAVVEFRDPTASPTDYYTLEATLSRGATAIQWARPEDADTSTPDGLVDLLDPIVGASIVDAHESRGLVARSEVN